MEKSLNHDILVTLLCAVTGGVAMIVLARKAGIPAIILLLTAGFLLGPEGLQFVKADSLGAVLPVFVSFAVGLVLFEGGLSLDIEGYRLASVLIKRLLTYGVLITWLLTAFAINIFGGLGPSFALLAASLVIVTGPTVVGPLMKLVRIRRNLHNVLTWEAVLIDPIGVFIAVLCFEYIVRGVGGTAATNFAMRLLCGLGIGLVGGTIIYLVLKRRWIPEDMTSVSALAGATLIFGIAELTFTESGLLSVIVAGLVIGARSPEQLKQIRQFKSELSDLMVGMLFILLASRLKIDQFKSFGWEGAFLVAWVMLIVRPVNVLLCSMGTGMTWKEKTFLAWIAPRGIVAASMASLFRITLEQHESLQPNVISRLAEFVGLRIPEKAVIDAAFVETFTYSVIITTIIIHGLTAVPLAKLLGLRRGTPDGWLVVGAHRLGREVARFLAARGLSVSIIDLNPRASAAAKVEGLEAITGDARHTAPIEEATGDRIGNVLALTDNEDLNVVICQRWAEVVGSNHVFRWNSGRGEASVEKESAGDVVWEQLPKPGLISAEISRGEATLSILEAPKDVDPEAKPDLSIPIVMVNGKQVRFYQETTVHPEAATVLALTRQGNYLLRSLRLRLVLRVATPDAAEAFALIGRRIEEQDRRVPGEQIAKSLIEREKLLSTYMGNGISIPHTYHPALTKQICVVVHAPDGMQFEGSSSEEFIRLMFVVVGPPGFPEEHLATLAEIAHIISNPARRERLLGATSTRELYTLVCNAAGQQSSTDLDA